jgi:hypothetical protein
LPDYPTHYYRPLEEAVEDLKNSGMFSQNEFLKDV